MPKMSEDKKNTMTFQRMICDCADELRDYWLVRQSEQDIKDIMALSISQQRMIRKVWRMTRSRSEGIMLKELAEKLSLSSSAVSVMVDAMVRRGILERQVSPDDRRRVMIRISGNGKEIDEKYDRFFDDISARFAETQTPENLQIFLNVLNDLNIFLDKQNKEK
ncbi:MAG: MarR family transcriptional regulator [Lentisphaerae bacterium]|nr:MarR family transcriptional regulator [Lentisphaerota bacterium]